MNFRNVTIWFNNRISGTCEGGAGIIVHGFDDQQHH